MRQSIINKLNSNSMSKKVIEQIKVVKYFGKGEKEPTVIDNPSARELTTVAKAICPEYQKVIDEVEFLRAERPVNIAIRNENKTLKDQNAKLVEALDTLLTRLNKNESMSDFVIATETVRAIIDQALQNTKNIEG